MTDTERKLWQVLRARQMEGFEFRRQHPMGRYTLDFYCPALKLAVEVDGGQHGSDAGRARDEKRTAWLETCGVRVVRIWNNDVLGNMEGVFEHIRDGMLNRQAEHGTPTPTLPLAGGGGECEVDR